MFNLRSDLLRAACLSAALLGTGAIVVSLTFAEPVHAAGGNGNGKGKGGGHANGNGAGKGAAQGRSASGQTDGAAGRSSKASTRASGGTGGRAEGTSFSKPEKKSGKANARPTSFSKGGTGISTSPKAPGKRDTLARMLGVHPSELGALNAANASANALAKAAPASRVGRIAAYRDAVLAGDALRVELEAAIAALNDLSAPGTDSATLTGNLATAREDQSAAVTTLDGLKAQLAEAGGTDPAIEAEIDRLDAEIVARAGAIGTLEKELADATAYESTSRLVDDLTDDVAAQDTRTTGLLQLASNKPVTDQVEAAVKEMLGLE